MDSCLFIHGFTGGEYEISPLSEYMEQHHYRSITFTLKGHGGSRQDLLHSDRHDWQRSAENELTKLLKTNEAVHLIGFSTGALIASQLSVQYKPRIKSLTLLSTPVFPLNPIELLKTFASLSMLRNYISKFGSTPAKATREFQRLVRESFDVYPQIETPTLIVQGKRDHLVKSKSANYLQQVIPTSHKQVLMVDNSGHMVCHCEDKDWIMNEVLKFIQRVG
ncbi:alpha/beta fold hydrolase [Paenibacillus sp. 19GGS1-52]|uniref:alpha/beta hydrolase n=1 Tax=Paenibacillus sp. 19GGS1-52 TaxID=2758563 RepID=UPI001EFB5403|nr:alpha/beta fold hydrolase [Paenibacillus sp. 19GGS1-52]ULO08366.1 alpha/beta fold hydrolase [Paenibacillus sp. 19GGS1-52]